MKTNKVDTELNLEVEKKKIGIRFRQLRKEKGYSSHENFAYEHKLDRAQYGKIEAGAANLTLKVFVKHLNVMKISFSDFFNDEYDSIEIDKTN